MIPELVKTNTKLEICEVTNRKSNVDKEALTAQVEHLKMQITNLTNTEITKYKDLKRDLEMEVAKLKDRNKDLEELYVYILCFIVFMELYVL